MPQATPDHAEPVLTFSEIVQAFTAWMQLEVDNPTPWEKWENTMSEFKADLAAGREPRYSREATDYLFDHTAWRATGGGESKQ